MNPELMTSIRIDLLEDSLKEARENLLPKPGVCGVFPEEHIYRGARNESLIDEHPWMALLEYSKRNFINKIKVST